MLRRFLLVTVTIVIVIGVALIWSRNVLMKFAVTAGVKAVTGLRLDIESIDIGVLHPVIRIGGMILFNPPEYSDRVMIDLSEIYVEYDPAALLKRQVHLPQVRLALQELNIIKNDQGVLNLSALKPVQQQPVENAAPVETPEPAVSSESLPWRIDSLKLSVQTVVYKNYFQSTPPKIRTFSLDFEEEYRDITSPDQLIRQVIGTILSRIPLRDMFDSALNKVSETLNDRIGQLTGGAVGTVLSGGLKIGGSAVKETGFIVDTAVQTLKGLLPFGERKK